MADASNPQKFSSVNGKIFADSLPICYYICNMLLSNEAAATAVCSDVYKKVLGSPERIPSEDEALTWMKNVAAVACSAFLRKQDEGVFLKNPTLPNVEKAELRHNRNLNVTATAKYVENCIARMPLPRRFAAICYYYNGMTVPQIATVMAVPVIRVKELMRAAATDISLLIKEFNDKRVTTTKIDICALLNVSAAAKALPDINAAELIENANIPQYTADEEQSKPKKSGRNAFIISMAALLLFVGVGLYVVNSLWWKPSSSTATTDSSDSRSQYGATESVEDTSSLPEVAESEAAAAVSSTPEKEEDVLGELPLYDVTHEIFYDADGEKIRECVYSYKDGKLQRVQTATQMFLEDLKYKWNKKGNKRTTTDGEGNICEVAWYDKQGNPTKLKYGDKEDETVKYKWTYSYDEAGRIKTAKYKGVNSGKYTYSYNKNGLISKVTETCDGDKYTTAYTYDDYGMVVTAVETDFDGTRTETFYTYNYEKLTFTATLSDGTKIEGKIALSTPEKANTNN